MSKFFKLLICLWICTANANTTHSITFRSETDLGKAVDPLSLEEVITRTSSSTTSSIIDFHYDAALSADKVISLRKRGIGNLLKTEVYKTKTLTVFYPEFPRVPHHLTIALNRSGIEGVGNVSEEENRELFATIKKIAEIYKTISIQGFVIAQFDTPQEGHLNRYVVELIPHIPGFANIKNIADKVDCNRHILFRTANLSPLIYKTEPNDILEQVQVWREAFQKEQNFLNTSDIQLTFPHTRKEAYQLEAEKVLCQHLLEILEDRGGKSEEIPFTPTMPLNVPEKIKSVTVEKCAFCDHTVIERQRIYEYGDISIFYNMRKSAKAGSNFLILPNRHVEKVYGLTDEEIRNIRIVRKALVTTLKETHPECEVIIYTQDDPSVGQTVFHSHEQVVAIDPKTIALTWTMMSLYPSGNVSSEEMLKIQEEFSLKLEQKIKEATDIKESA